MRKCSENLTGKSLNPKEIDLWLDDYNDLFSDFDNRPYIQRGLSDDFLFELKRASQYKDKEGIKLNLFLPKKKRVERDEKVIKQRLLDHFNRHWKLLEKEAHDMIRRGIAFAVVGFLIMILVTTFFKKYENLNLILNSLIVLFEISGWFMLWEGLYEIVFKTKDLKPDMLFYRKMATAKIAFLTSTSKC